MPGLDRTLAALADPTRRGIVEKLSRRPHRAGELAKLFATSAPAISRHLRILRTGGLIEDERVERDARLRLFRLRREPFVDLATWLADVEKFWNEQLDSFRTHVARRNDVARKNKGKPS
jgi:DNA-binding transcriptional ArsR family regulator